ncbi:DUF3124 domain-containing protein [Halobacteriovorax marinus]|uniref:DUF3124 domain-containing protein n=1 Tax=Halobacteriovorax marinus TaxID=97084 RepID=UPI003A95545F
MLEKVKTISIVISMITLVFLAKNFSQYLQPSKSYSVSYEVVEGLNEDISKSFKLNSDKKLIYSYVPAYSNIYESKGESLPMAITLSLRNIDLKNSLQIEKVLYYNTSGNLIRSYFKEGITLAPLETREVFVQKSDVEGGSGANFIVIFSSKDKIIPPIFEAVMTSSGAYGKSYVFTSRGVIYSGHGEQFSTENTP